MALVVETGAGLPNAESYVSVADFKTYADGRGLDYTVANTDDLVEQALRRATAYVDTYRNRFSGYRTNRRAQALEWPRIGAYYYVPDNGRSIGFIYPTDRDDQLGSQGYDYIPANVVPPEVIQATCEAAVREAAAPGSMQPDLERGGAIQELQAGSVRIVYAANASAQTTTQIIDSILDALLMANANGGLFGRAARG
jgi:hypothetical protein